MVLCATAWMLSAGFVTLQKRHIGITVFYLMASDRTRWWLDLFAMIVGVFALYMLVSATRSFVRSRSIDLIERAGTALELAAADDPQDCPRRRSVRLSHPASHEPLAALPERVSMRVRDPCSASPALICLRATCSRYSATTTCGEESTVRRAWTRAMATTSACTLNPKEFRVDVRSYGIRLS